MVDEPQQGQETSINDSLSEVRQIDLPHHTSQGQTFRDAWVTGRRLVVDLIVILIWVFVADFLLYQQNTFAAWALFLVWSAIFLWANHRSLGHRSASLITGLLLTLLSVKLVWCGDWLQVGCGLFLVFCFTMALTGVAPFLPELVGFLSRVGTGAARRLARYRINGLGPSTQTLRNVSRLPLVMPLAVLLLFATLFILANPDLATAISRSLEVAVDSVWNMVQTVEFAQAVFWCVSGWVALGLLYPGSQRVMRETAIDILKMPQGLHKDFLAYRNTLVSVSGLFTVYLVYEFVTLWRRDFPADFYYAGYAHEGAFWLTVALAVATGLLSFMFRASVLHDPRLRQLKAFALLWSALNFLLSIAVYNRLLIYMDFNGLTRMRVIGLLGITSVVVGFGIVVYKLMANKSFVWLLHRQLWVPVGAIVLYSILPVDWIVTRINVDRYRSGHEASVVQIAAHRCKTEGALPLTELAFTENEITRNGIRALLAVWARELEVESGTITAGNTSTRDAWQSTLGHSSPWVGIEKGFSRRDRDSELSLAGFQVAESLLKERLLSVEDVWQPYYQSEELRTEALNAFFQYAYEWY